MPDLDRVLTHTCSSNDHWGVKITSSSRPDISHIVTYARGEYSCSCEAFTYNGKCGHTGRAEKMRCGWGADAYANVIYEDKVCPECGEDTIPFYVGV